MIEIPQRLKKFPLWMGKFVIHYTVFVKDGIPDFKCMHEVRRIDAFNRNLCHLCGERMLNTLFAFIGGPKCVKYRAFVDGPMHPDCAEYACKVCPFLRDAKAEYSKRTGGGARPEKMYLCLAEKYMTRRNPSNWKYRPNIALADLPHQPDQMVCHASDWVSVMEIPTENANETGLGGQPLSSVPRA